VIVAARLLLDVLLEHRPGIAGGLGDQRRQVELDEALARRFVLALVAPDDDLAGLLAVRPVLVVLDVLFVGGFLQGRRVPPAFAFHGFFSSYPYLFRNKAFQASSRCLDSFSAASTSSMV